MSVTGAPSFVVTPIIGADGQLQGISFGPGPYDGGRPSFAQMSQYNNIAGQYRNDTPSANTRSNPYWSSYGQ